MLPLNFYICVLLWNFVGDQASEVLKDSCQDLMLMCQLFLISEMSKLSKPWTSNNEEFYFQPPAILSDFVNLNVADGDGILYIIMLTKWLGTYEIDAIKSSPSLFLSTVN